MLKFHLSYTKVASGMEFLARQSIYHGDLACRNILLTDDLIAKVADFGLSKRLYHQTYARYNKDDEDLFLPFKWVAIETLQDLKTSPMSDIWSYGVLLWEMFELGAEPYGPGNQK